jgi:hypothetical protein
VLCADGEDKSQVNGQGLRGFTSIRTGTFGGLFFMRY